MKNTSAAAKVPERETSPDNQANREEIAERAHQIWLDRGCPEGTAEQDWLEAERQINAANASRNVMTATRKQDGSVQR